MRSVARDPYNYGLSRPPGKFGPTVNWLFNAP